MRSQTGTVPIGSPSAPLHQLHQLFEFNTTLPRALQEYIRYPSETKGQDRPTPSPESGHSAGCSWAPVRVQALREQERVLQEQVLRERVLRERVPGQGCSVQPQVQRARQCR